MKKNRFPKGWNEAKVREVIEYYDSQTEDEAALEMEARDLRIEGAVMVVPYELVNRVREIRAEFEKLKARKKGRRGRTG